MRERWYPIAWCAALLLAAGCRSPQEHAGGVACCDEHARGSATEPRAANTQEPPTATFHSAGEAAATRWATPWLEPTQRTAPSDFLFEEQRGRSLSLAELRGAPVALSFAYTRCENERKCPAVARSLGQIERSLAASGLQPRPYLALITYDPEYDTPEVLTRFAEAHGLATTGRVLLLRPVPERKGELFKSLHVAVNYNNGAVNVHGIQLLLLDKQGRYVRTYHTMMWETDAVVADLAKLAAE